VLVVHALHVFLPSRRHMEGVYFLCMHFLVAACSVQRHNEWSSNCVFCVLSFGVIAGAQGMGRRAVLV
jgi:hypothetical protein